MFFFFSDPSELLSNGDHSFVREKPALFNSPRFTEAILHDDAGLVTQILTELCSAKVTVCSLVPANL